MADQVTKITTGAQLTAALDLPFETRLSSAVFDWGKGVSTSQTTDPGGLAITMTTTCDDHL